VGEEEPNGYRARGVANVPQAAEDTHRCTVPPRPRHPGHDSDRRGGDHRFAEARSQDKGDAPDKPDDQVDRPENPRRRIGERALMTVLSMMTSHTRMKRKFIVRENRVHRK
jgi:hypothetical protein